MAAHAQIIENGQVRLEGDQPEMRYFFVPVAEAELLDTWHVRGMRGTGTHHFAVNDVFVPAERTVLSATAPALEPGPLYKIPRTLAFASGDAAVALGMGAQLSRRLLRAGRRETPRAMPALPATSRWSRSMSARPRRAALRRAFPDGGGAGYLEQATAGSVTLEKRAVLRLATTHGIRLAAQIIDTVYNAAGATAATRAT